MAEEPSERGPAKPPDSLPIRGILFVVAALVALWLIVDRDEPWGTRAIPYSEFKHTLAQGAIESCRIESDRVIGKMKGDEGSRDSIDFMAYRVDDPKLLEELEAAGVDYRGAPDSTGTGAWVWLLPLMFLPLLFLFVLRQRGGIGGAAMSFGRSKARLVADMDTGVDFDDVAGCDEAKLELQEVVEFLRQPERFTRLGAKIPKGVLLVGPPGTGKTLLARAVAGEAKVPFFSISGSEFVEMFVGVGAARVRDLFEQAQKRAPCIVFIDEIDAIGRSRGFHVGAVNDEREQTLNQILVELDGFEPNSGVILLAATNRPDVLDRALLRPGRFDRQVVLDVPDVVGREAILRVHAHGKPFADGVDLATIARATPGFAGADLANALNESALLATRRNHERITQGDVDAAIEKVVAGPERKSRRLRDVERRRVAYHEAGHALVARLCPHADPVHKISIVPRGQRALGYTMQLPREDQALLTRAELDDKVTSLLGGRAAEELVFDEVSTGAADDLERATALVRRMLCVFGMGQAVGLMHCAQDRPGAPVGPETATYRDCSETTARAIDTEVQAVLDRAYRQACELLRGERDKLELLAETLYEQERLDGAAIDALVAANEHATRPSEEATR